MTLVNLSIQHLSDEAVAAYADGWLRGMAAHRAQRHVAECAECAYAVAVQREAALLLRSAPNPAPTNSLLERLRAVPVSTPLNGTPIGLGPDGQPVFAAFGTVLPTAALVEPTPQRRPAEDQQADSRALRHPSKFGLHLGLAAAAAAVVAVGVVAVETEATASGSGGGQRPVTRVNNANHIQPVSGTSTTSFASLVQAGP